MAGGTILFSLNEAVHFHQHLCNLEPICQTFEPAEDPPPSLPNLDQLEVADEKTCMICGQVFETRLHQVEHFRSDWHRLNVKGKLRGIPALSEVEFEELGSDCESISASESGTDDGAEKDRVEIVFDAGKLLFMNSQGSVVEINRILLTTKNESVTSTELLARVESLKDLWLGLIIISGGHFAAAVYHSGKMIRHKTFHQYTVRKKQGGAQSHFDSKSGAAKSAGASLRRYNEKTLMEKSHAILKTWSELDRCSVILFRALGADNRSILFGGSDPVFRKGDIRLRTIPMVTRRPTVKELDRIYGVLTTVKVVHNPSSYYKTKNVTLTIGKSGVKSSKQVTSKKSSEIFEEDNGLNDSRPRRERSKIVPTPAKELIEDVFTTCRDDDVDELKAIVSKTDSHCLKQALTSSLDDHGNTVLHFCCRRGRLAILETILALGADPTMTNNDGQAPYVVATSDKVREVLISFRLANPEMWDFDKASIPDKLPQAKKTSGTCAKSAKENTQMVKNTRRVIEKKSCNSFKKVIDRITSCHLCNKQFHTVPLEADGKPFCSINCVRAWRYS